MDARAGPEEEPTAPEVGNMASGDAHGVTVQAGAIYGGVRIHAGDNDRAPPRQLPMPVGAFVNRAEELAVLSAAPSSEARRHSIHAICGGPGTGKTALALHWAGRDGPFPDGELYIDMRAYGPGRPVSVDLALDVFLRSLNVPPDDIPREIDQRAAMYRSRTSGKRLLVLVDNVAGAEQVRPLLPGSTTCRVVVTSRSTLPGLVVREGAIRLLLGELGVDDSLDVFRTIVGADKVDHDPIAAAKLVELCGRLPLALRIVAERVAHSGEPDLARAVEALTNENERLDALDDPDDELASVRAAFAYSYHRLGVEDARVFRLLGVHPTKSLPMRAVAALTDLGAAAARRAVDRLVKMSLLDRVAHERYRLHDLLRLYAAERAQIEENSAEQQAALRRLASWYLRNVDAAQRRILPNIGTPEPAGVADAGPILEFPTVDSAMTWFETERENLVDLTVAAKRAAFLRTGRPPGVIALGDEGPPLRKESTVEQRTHAVVSFYAFQRDVHGVGVHDRWVRPGVSGRVRYRRMLHHLGSRSYVSQRRRVGRPVPREVPRGKILTPGQVDAIHDACARWDDERLSWVGRLRDRLLFETLAETGMRQAHRPGAARRLLHAAPTTQLRPRQRLPRMRELRHRPDLPAPTRTPTPGDPRAHLWPQGLAPRPHRHSDGRQQRLAPVASGRKPQARSDHRHPGRPRSRRPPPRPVTRGPGPRPMTTADDIRVANLRQAARRKQADADARARQAVKHARKSQQPVTFRGIAEAAGVSTSFLYNHPELRAQIDRLRGSSSPRPRRGDDPTGQVATLKALLEAAASEKTALLRRNEQLNNRLAAAHGELLELRRSVGATNRSSSATASGVADQAPSP